MANVNIKFNNKDYLLSCDDGQEENLKQLANLKYLTEKWDDQPAFFRGTFETLSKKYQSILEQQGNLW